MSVAHDSRIRNGNRTEWSPIRSVIIRLIRDLSEIRRGWGGWKQREGNLQVVDVVTFLFVFGSK